MAISVVLTRGSSFHIKDYSFKFGERVEVPEDIARRLHSAHADKFTFYDIPVFEQEPNPYEPKKRGRKPGIKLVKKPKAEDLEAVTSEDVADEGIEL